MKKSHIVRTVCAVGISAACAWSLAGCSTSGEAAKTDGTDSGAVAVTIDGVNINEDEITSYIESLRTQRGLTDEESWGTYLAQNAATPATARDDVISTFITRELIRTHSADRGVAVESSEIDSYIDQMKQNYESDEKWQTALEQAKMTEEDYRAEIDLQLKAKYLYESFASDEEVSDADQLQYAQMYASAYNGAKRSSHILFKTEDKDKAQEVLDKINSGELDFAAAATEFSTDTGTATKGGDVGWDKTATLVTEYQTALDGLEKDQVSGLVTSTYGIHIIKCTDVYNTPMTTGADGVEKADITSADQVPAEWLDSIKESLKTQKQNETYQAWLTEIQDAADITINDMPAGMPYDIDMSKYPAETATDGTAGAVDAGTGDAATSGENTAEAPSDAATGTDEADAAAPSQVPEAA